MYPQPTLILAPRPSWSSACATRTLRLAGPLKNNSWKSAGVQYCTVLVHLPETRTCAVAPRQNDEVLETEGAPMLRQRGRRRELVSTKPCCSISCPPPVAVSLRLRIVSDKLGPGPSSPHHCPGPASGCARSLVALIRIQCCTVLTESLNLRARLSCSTVRLHYKQTP